MLIGHYAPALLLKSRVKTVPLWALFIGVEVLDYLWSGFILVGLEHMRLDPLKNATNGFDLYDMPYSHSLVATLGWSLLAFGITAFWQRGKPGQWMSALAIALAVASHYACDLVVHVKDLPLVGNDTLKLGFGLWNDRWLALVVETAFFIASAAVFTLTPPWKTNRRWWVLAGAMSVVCVANYFIPAPATDVALAFSGLGVYVALPLLAWRAELTSGGASSPSPG